MKPKAVSKSTEKKPEIQFDEKTKKEAHGTTLTAVPASKAQVAKAKKFQVCSVGVPTFGWVSVNWHLTMHHLATPIFFSLRFVNVIGKQVDEARNKIVEDALQFGCSHILFVDDDVLPPRDGLIRLWNHQVPIAAGVYYSKAQPPKPLIFRFGELSGVEDWKMGDLLKVDACGMGFTLIQTDVFKKMKPPWFKTVVDNKDGVDCTYTEDIYFCERVRKELGLDVLVDTGIQCGHEDFDNMICYQYDARAEGGAWRKYDTNEIVYLPKGSKHPELVKDKTTKPKGKKA